MFCNVNNVFNPGKGQLRTSKGKWEVEFQQNGGGMCLCGTNGWIEFANANAISEGDFMILNHEGGLNFYVRTFGGKGFEQVCRYIGHGDATDEQNQEVVLRHEHWMARPCSFIICITTSDFIDVVRKAKLFKLSK